MNAIETIQQQDQIVKAIAQAIREPWSYVVVNTEIDVVDGEQTENSIALSYSKRFWRLNSRGEELPHEHFSWFVALREKMADPIGSRWGSCTVVFDRHGHYQFDFSYDPPPRLNGVYNDTTMLKHFDPKSFLKRHGNR